MPRFVPRHEFEKLAKRHHAGREFCNTSRWSQFIALATGQLAGRNSLRDAVSNLYAQSRSLYHPGTSLVTRSTLARLNEQQPHQLYEALFEKLYAQCRPTVLICIESNPAFALNNYPECAPCTAGMGRFPARQMGQRKTQISGWSGSKFSATQHRKTQVSEALRNIPEIVERLLVVARRLPLRRLDLFPRYILVGNHCENNG
ncbi:MAG: DUF4372 domain-containing protein [Gammaproteobacteria bacterium]